MMIKEYKQCRFPDLEAEKKCCSVTIKQYIYKADFLDVFGCKEHCSITIKKRDDCEF